MRYRVLFVNDTARNGGPGRSLQIILKFVDPRVVHRSVVLPRAGAVSELLVGSEVVDELHFEPHLVENVFAPLTRSMRRDDFAAPLGLRAGRAVANAGRAALGLGRLARLVRRGRYDLIYCNGTTADFAGGLLARLTGVPALWHVRYTSLPAGLAALHRRLSSGPRSRASCAYRAPPPRCSRTARTRCASSTTRSTSRSSAGSCPAGCAASSVPRPTR